MNHIKRMTLSSTMLAGLLLTCAGAGVAPAMAQDAAGPADEAEPGAIIVTARKRSEDILKTPVTVSALTSEDISKRGIVSVSDIAANTPGMNVNNASSGRTDRSFQQIILRGFTPADQTITTTSMFIDGVPVASATALGSVDDPERVEVLKGPQSAFFGRNTFAGAVNVVTKTPKDSFGGKISFMGGTRENYDVHADIEGPILDDKLTFRVSGRKFSKNGSWKNAANPDQTLGDQSTTSGSLLLVAKPTSDLTLKAFGLYSVNKDGPSAQGMLSAYEIRSNGGRVNVPGLPAAAALSGVDSIPGAGTLLVADQSNCTLNGYARGQFETEARVQRRFFCGTLPGLSSLTPAANTVLDSYLSNFLAQSPTGRRLVNPSDGTDAYGLKSRYYHAHFNIDYAVGDTGFILSSLTGYNNEYFSEMADLDNYNSVSLTNGSTPFSPLNPNPNAFVPATAPNPTGYTLPFLVERKTNDFSQELRFSYDNDGPLKLSGGGSYLYSFSQGGLGGNNLGLNSAPNFGMFAIAGASVSKTSGLFFSATYSPVEALTISAEGRYQFDKVIAKNSPLALVNPNGVLLQQTYKNFLPRIIAQYQMTPDIMGYASWSKGVNPGRFNTNYLTLDPVLRPVAESAGIDVKVDPEKLTNYEIGFKGRVLNGKMRFAISAYYAKWTDQINTIVTSGIDSNGQIQIISGAANTGETTLKGLEIDTTTYVMDNLTINASGSINDSHIDKFTNPTITQISGIFDFSGKETPNSSKYSANIGMEYGTSIAGMDDASWFGRADFSYKSGLWTSQSNLAKTPARKVVNLRAGISKGPMALEAFVTNVFNDKNYTSVNEQALLTPMNAFSVAPFNGANSYLIVGLPELRTFGLKGSFKF